MIYASKKSKRTCNPIRNIVDKLSPPQNHEKRLLNLALGDPTIHGNLKCPETVQRAVQDALLGGRANGYLASVGLGSAKHAIAVANSHDGFTIADDDVIIASGCSGALDLAITVLVNEGDNILVPKPCFPLYQVITESLGGSVKHYPLIPESNWECNLPEMERLIDSNTKAIVINNPSNPCGSNFTAKHLMDIAAVARRHNLPIIADEIYRGCVFKGHFSPMMQFCGDVPVLSVGGLAKQFIVPGWRVGWVIIHDNGTGRFSDVRKGMRNLSQIILGANSLIQAAIPRILTPEKGSVDEDCLAKFSVKYMDILRRNANVCMTASKKCSLIRVIEPMGAMYCMVGVDIESLENIKDDADFARQLLVEENLFVLPGQCFTMKNFIRLVICPGADALEEAFERIRLFCERHRKMTASTATATTTISSSSSISTNGEIKTVFDSATTKVK